MKRSLLVGATIVLAAVGVYAAAGFWLTPHLAAQALQARAAALGITLTLGEVRTNLFKLTVAFTDVDLVGPDGNRLAAAPRLQIDLAWASLWQDGWIAQRVWVDSPYLEVVLDEGGLNWPAPRAGKNGEAGAPAAVRVHELVLENGTLRFLDRSRAAGAEAMLEGVRLEIGNLSTHEGEGQYRLQGRLAPGGVLDSSGIFSLSPAAAHGKLTLSNASLATAWRLALPSSEPGEGRVTLLTAYAYEEGRVVLHDLQARAKSVSYAGMGIESVALAVPRLAIPPAQPVQVSVQAELASGGKLAARGSVHPRSLAADVAVEAEGLPLPLAQRFLPESTALRLAGGKLSAKGRLQAEERRIAFEGSAEIADLRVEERDYRRVLLGWELARAEQVAVSAAPVAIEVGELVVRAPEGRIVIERDGSVNFAEVVPGDGEKQDKGRAPLRASVRRLALENGTLHFADRSLETPFAVTMRELSGNVTGLRTAAGDPARLQIEGRVGEYGSVRIRGTTDLDQPKSLANVTARFENVSLAQLTPYVVKFAGYRVRSGRVSAELRYRIRDARLLGENRFVFQELELGEKVERAGAPDLPLELAVALLADAKGRITLNIPVRGNLNDPQFDFGGLVARALGNVIGKLVSAPFRALAGLFGAKGEALDEVRFEPGSAALSPPQEENIAKVAQALAERPQLGLTVQGSYDPERDAAALRRAAARRDIAQRAGYKSDGPLDFTDARTLRAAEALYLERIGKRADLQALRANEPRYGRALLELLAYTLPEDRGDPQALARERAQAVRAALAERGVDPGRVALEPPTADEATESGVPTQLSLTPHAAGAAAGATR